MTCVHILKDDISSIFRKEFGSNILTFVSFVSFTASCVFDYLTKAVEAWLGCATPLTVFSRRCTLRFSPI